MLQNHIRFTQPPTLTQAISYSQVNTTIAQTIIHILSPTPNQPKDEKKKKVSKKSLRIQEVSFNSTENQCVSLCCFVFVNSSLSRELSKIVHSHMSQFVNSLSITQLMQASSYPQLRGLLRAARHVHR